MPSDFLSPFRGHCNSNGVSTAIGAFLRHSYREPTRMTLTDMPRDTLVQAFGCKKVLCKVLLEVPPDGDQAILDLLSLLTRAHPAPTDWYAVCEDAYARFDATHSQSIVAVSSLKEWATLRYWLLVRFIRRHACPIPDLSEDRRVAVPANGSISQAVYGRLARALYLTPGEYAEKENPWKKASLKRDLPYGLYLKDPAYTNKAASFDEAGFPFSCALHKRVKRLAQLSDTPQYTSARIESLQALTCTLPLKAWPTTIVVTQPNQCYVHCCGRFYGPAVNLESMFAFTVDCDR